MLASRYDEPVERGGVRPSTEAGIERRVGGLRSPGDESDAAGRNAGQLRDLRTRLLDDQARRPSLGVNGGRVARRFQGGESRRARFRAQRRRRIVVQICSVAYLGGHDLRITIRTTA